MDESKMLAADREETALDRDEFTTVQLYQELVILPDDGYAEFLLLDASRR
jgi:hypothetical protein